DLKDRLVQLRQLPPTVLEIIDRIPKDSSPMDVLRTAVSALAVFEPAETQPGASSIGGAQRLTAVLPTILGYYHRRRSGVSPIGLHPELGHAAYLLAALSDRPATELEIRALDVALILHADHELNAS
ncbi:MAG: citrate synthase, partial [Thermoplasmata archaeon]|nr:citrate synthase [Thermoplasmata archaeon]